MKKVIIIGAGLGGLSSAIYLRKMGYEVEIFEKNNHIGGKVNEFNESGYRFDMGPSLITMPFVIKHLISFAGYKPDELIEFEEIAPICRYFYPDGNIIDAYSDIDLMQNELAKLNQRDAENFPKFLEYSKKIYDLTSNLFLFDAFYSPDVIFRMDSLKTLLQINKIDPFRTVDEGVRRFFSDERVIQLFNRYATYNGSDPYKAPATLNIIPWVEYGLKSYYIKGGIFELSRVLGKICNELGIKINLNCEVSSLETKNNKVESIKVNNEKYRADIFLANSDVIETYNNLIKNNKSKYKYNKLEASISGYIGLWGIKDNFDDLKHHNIFFTENYKQEFETIFNKKQVYSDPTIYVSITSKKDKTHAPENSENWFVLLNMPYLDKNQDFSKVDENIFKKLKNFGFDVKDKIDVKKDIDPKDLYDLYKSNKGSIYGISSNDRNSAFLRPKNFSKEFNNLFFAGGSSHPGGGVPLVMLSGKIAANLINKKYR